MSENFVCVRTYVGLPGTDSMLKQYGIVGTRGAKGPWTRSNNIDFVFFSPTLKPVTYDGFKEVTLEPTAESQDSVRWVYTVIGGCSREKSAPVATEAMKKVVELYPPRNKEVSRVPWHLNADTALHFASFEDRRMIVVPATKGAPSAKLTAALEDPDLLRKHIHNYAFLKLETGQVPAELQAALKEAGPDGMVLLERPEGRAPGTSPWKSAQILAAFPGPCTREGVFALLDKHARPPGWDAKPAPPR